MESVVGFGVGVLLTAACLWAAMKVTGVQGSLLGLLAIAVVCEVVERGLPVLGWPASVVLMVVLVSRWTSAEVWPDAVLMVAVAWLVSAVGAFLLSGLVA